MFQAFVHVDPEQSETILSEIKKISSDLVENGITHDELKRALEPTLTGIKDMMRENSYWLNTVLSGSREHPQQLDWSRTIMKDYASITTNELWLLAKKYLDNKKVATIVVKPE